MSVEGGTTLKVTDESLAQAARVIRDGGLVVIPTDTVYGVACDPRNKAAIDRIYRLKRRPRYKALQVLLASTDQLDELGLDLPSPLNRLVGGVSAWRVLADCRSPARLHVGDFGRHRRWSPRHARHPHPQFGAVPRDSQGDWPAGRVQRQPVPATKARRPSRRRLTRSAAKSTCIWTAVPPKAMSPAPSSKPIRTRATASRSCVKASSPKT